MEKKLHLCHLQLSASWKGEEGWERLQQGKQQLQGSSFPFTAGSELTGSASKNVTQLGHFVCYCWDMKGGCSTAGYRSSLMLSPFPNRGSLVWCREPAERTFFCFWEQVTSGVVSLLLIELTMKGQERRENRGLVEKKQDSLIMYRMNWRGQLKSQGSHEEEVAKRKAQ